MLYLTTHSTHFIYGYNGVRQQNNVIDTTDIEFIIILIVIISCSFLQISLEGNFHLQLHFWIQRERCRQSAYVYVSALIFTN